jgi:hypothetical protein
VRPTKDTGRRRPHDRITPAIRSTRLAPFTGIVVVTQDLHGVDNPFLGVEALVSRRLCRCVMVRGGPAVLLREGHLLFQSCFTHFCGGLLRGSSLADSLPKPGNVLRDQVSRTILALRSLGRDVVIARSRDVRGQEQGRRSNDRVSPESTVVNKLIRTRPPPPVVHTIRVLVCAHDA